MDPQIGRHPECPPKSAEEYSYDDLWQRIPIELARLIDLQQIEDIREHTVPTNGWLESLRSEKSQLANPQVADLLITNTEVYDDEVEDYLEEDIVLEFLAVLRDDHRNDNDYTTAVRARRTIVTRLLLEELKAFVYDEPNGGEAA